jgi:hypothetical protein
VPDSNRSHQVGPETVRDLYRDPLIKYSGILDGLFSHGVILCEADSDSTYYRAVLDYLKETSPTNSALMLDLHFAHCNGKSRIPKAAALLRAANVPVVCAVDFDILQNKADFDNLVTSCGGNPADFQGFRNTVVSDIIGKGQRVARSTTRAAIVAVLDAGRGVNLESSEISKISSAIKAPSGWQESKRSGRQMLSGQAITAFDSMNMGLCSVGIFIVPVGELERFHPEIGSANKAKWLREVLEGEVYKESEEAQKYVGALARSILEQQAT